MDPVRHQPPLDRAAELRPDREAVEAMARDDAARVILHRGTSVPVAGGTGDPRLIRISAPALLESGVPTADMFFLGVIEGAALFGYELPEGADDVLPADVLWLELVVASMMLPAEEAGLLNYIVGLSNWRHTHLFCPRCGQRYSLGESGHVLLCPAGHRSHPRVEPVVQMLVHDGERCVLGRSPGWPLRWFSTLAGFVEPGETPEEAAVREVREEARLDVLDTRYSASQFFAGPYSLMLGFVARVADARTATTGDELESVIALTRAELTEMLADGAMKVPLPPVLAGSLINDWLAAPPTAR